MFLVVVALIIIAYVVGWQWGAEVSAAIWKGLKWIGAKLREGFSKLWAKITKKKNVD